MKRPLCTNNGYWTMRSMFRIITKMSKLWFIISTCLEMKLFSNKAINIYRQFHYYIIIIVKVMYKIYMSCFEIRFWLYKWLRVLILLHRFKLPFTGARARLRKCSLEENKTFYACNLVIYTHKQIVWICTIYFIYTFVYKRCLSVMIYK